MMEELDLNTREPEVQASHDPYEDSDEEETPESLGQAYVDLNPNECMIMGEAEAKAEEKQDNPDIPEDEVLEMTGGQRDFSKMKFSENVRCRLCACNQTEAHTPPFFRSCSFFRGQIPQKIQQRCCYGFHSALSPGTTCPVVKALGQRPFRPIYNNPRPMRRYGQQGQQGQQQRPHQSGYRGPAVAQRPPFTPSKQVF